MGYVGGGELQGTRNSGQQWRGGHDLIVLFSVVIDCKSGEESFLGSGVWNVGPGVSSLGGALGES